MAAAGTRVSVLLPPTAVTYLRVFLNAYAQKYGGVLSPDFPTELAQIFIACVRTEQRLQSAEHRAKVLGKCR
jgi:hypothetical protein